MRSEIKGLFLVLFGFGCGPAAERSQPWIYGGEFVRPDEASFIRTSTVALQIRSTVMSKPSFVHQCSGTIIAPQVVLTATHCLSKINPSDMRVVFDVHAYTIPIDDSVRTRTVSHVFTNELFQTKLDNQHDIGLVFLNAPVPPPYQPIALYQEALRKGAGEEVVLAGYGNNSPSFKYDEAGNMLKDEKGALVKVERDPKIPLMGLLKSLRTRIKMISAAGAIVIEPSREQTPCLGDSGGPLYIEEGGTWYVAGATSGGSRVKPLINDCLNDLGEVKYASTSFNLDFIKQYLEL